MTNAERQRRYRKRRRARRKFFTGVGNSSKFNGWQTPADLGAALSEAVGGFDLDPCSATSDPALARVKALRLLTIDDDGLEAQWAGIVYCNPPYGRVLSRWVGKCASEAASGRAIVVGLLPARTDTRWWHDHVARSADILMLRGRLSFGDGKQAAPFPSAVVVWGADPDLTRRIAAALPGAWHVGEFRYVENRYEIAHLDELLRVDGIRLEDTSPKRKAPARPHSNCAGNE